MKKFVRVLISLFLVTILLCSSLPFAVSAVAVRIGSVSVDDLNVPIEGDYGDYTVTLGNTTYDLLDQNDIEYINGIRWIDEYGNVMVPGIDRFEAGVSYTVEINLVPKESNLFMVINATLNGETVDFSGNVNKITLTKTFSATEDSPHIHKVTFDYGFDGIVEYNYCYTGEGLPLPVPKDYDNGELVLFGWYEDPDFKNEFDFDELVFEDKTVYARYVDPADIVSVYMFTTDNDFPYNITEAVIGDYLSVEDPYEDGLFFTEWYGDPDRVFQYNFSQPVTGDVYLYARMISYDDVATVYTYMPDEYFYTDVYEVEKGRYVDIPDPEVDEMYFAGWFCDREYTKPFDKSQPITEDVLIYAKFLTDEDICYVHIYLDTDVPIASGMIEKGTIYSIDDPGKEDMEFVGWYCEPERITPFDFSQPITEDVSIYAKFVPTGLLGDADEDGIVNIKDATAIQKHIAGMTQLTAKGETLADVDKSGKINILDATIIQKHCAGMTVNYPVGQPNA